MLVLIRRSVGQSGLGSAFKFFKVIISQTLGSHKLFFMNIPFKKHFLDMGGQ
ncbi:hypothetical protein HanXRQr2_Chr11g0507361 [Helianthus annuus]|uniref:Uncharacterized protein n=1 Tax=Helianthus annuus TaxID=4232 RepID=A0A9K3HSN3_HELAN|nr:hypothetical protein HanXRQr2_Chr11g0507361 [Helianthus annuus]KAJ0876480.1 hypothetical protein HanPSC8_Chr11g0488951 [Helianthus annuus]